MAIVLPDDGDLEAHERRLDAAAMAQLLTGFEPAGVDLDLPRWTIRTQLRHKQALEIPGMPTAFTDSADFSGMTTDVPLEISEVLHVAFIAVDETGAEAAAATAIVNAGAMPVPITIAMTVDRPFIVVIHDVETATPLSVGRFDNPTA